VTAGRELQERAFGGDWMFHFASGALADRIKRPRPSRWSGCATRLMRPGHEVAIFILLILFILSEKEIRQTSGRSVFGQD
jgi:hypothetical protein